MRCLGAAILSVAGLLMLVLGTIFVDHPGPRVFVCTLGGLIAFAGLIGWNWAKKTF